MRFLIVLSCALLAGFLAFSIVWSYSHAQWLLMCCAGLALTILIKLWRERVGPWYRKTSQK